MGDPISFTIRFGANGQPPQTFTLLPEQKDRAIRIGRASANDVVVRLPGVSWNHAELKLGEGADGKAQLVVVDTSSNCTGLKVPGGTVQKLKRDDATVVPNCSMIILPMKVKSDSEEGRACLGVEIDGEAAPTQLAAPVVEEDVVCAQKLEPPPEKPKPPPKATPTRDETKQDKVRDKVSERLPDKIPEARGKARGPPPGNWAPGPPPGNWATPETRAKASARRPEVPRKPPSESPPASARRSARGRDKSVDEAPPASRAAPVEKTDSSREDRLKKAQEARRARLNRERAPTRPPPGDWKERDGEKKARDEDGDKKAKDNEKVRDGEQRGNERRRNGGRARTRSRSNRRSRSGKRRSRERQKTDDSSRKIPSPAGGRRRSGSRGSPGRRAPQQHGRTGRATTDRRSRSRSGTKKDTRNGSGRDNRRDSQLSPPARRETQQPSPPPPRRETKEPSPPPRRETQQPSPPQEPQRKDETHEVEPATSPAPAPEEAEVSEQKVLVKCPKCPENLVEMPISKETSQNTSHRCDGCGRKGIRAPEMIFRCTPCNWDHCSKCAEEKAESKAAKENPASVAPEAVEPPKPATRTKAAPGKRPEELERQASLIEISREEPSQEEPAVDLSKPSTEVAEAEADELDLKRQVSEIDLLASPAQEQDGDKQDGEKQSEAATGEPDRPAAAPGQGPWKRSRNKACVALDDDSGDEAPANHDVVDLDDR